jgi:ABC-type sugar transport system ATPase subunit
MSEARASRETVGNGDRSSLQDPPLLELRGVSKSFPGVRAVEDVDFAVHGGEVAGLVGENGAGKSTLMKVIAGIYRTGSYEGSVRVLGEEQGFRSVHDAESKGIVLVPQELYIAPELSIAENMFVGRLPGGRGMVDEDALYAEASSWLTFFDVKARPTAPAATLTPSEQREVMLAAALSKEARILILDEPTASLSESESERLFEHVDRLRESGVAIVYISHRLDEIERVADSVTVMRNGRIVRRFDRRDMNHRETVRAMIGRDPESIADAGRTTTKLGEPVMSVSNLRVYDPVEEAIVRVGGANFTLRRGEVLGLFGLVGAGRSELARALFGNWPGRVEGDLLVDGKGGLPSSPRDAIRRGMAMVTEDRKKSGIFPGQSVNSNISAASISKVSSRLRIRPQAEYERNANLAEKLRIKTPSLATAIDYLSGGNQQKTIVARWLAAAPRVLILDEPTTGVDVGARFELYRIIHELAAEGRGVLLISSDLEEIVTQCTRVLVMYKGNIQREFDQDLDRHSLMSAATGGTE